MARNDLSALVSTFSVDPTGRRARTKPDLTEDSEITRRVTGGLAVKRRKKKAA
jgi:hypothetical protein